MEYKFYFNTNLEKEEIIANNEHLTLLLVAYHFDENYLLFTDAPPSITWEEEINDKISILEAENETLKQELSITQDAVNELIFNSLNI